MKYNSITIIDIAKALGVSKSTVSRALNGNSEINATTKENILAYARQHNYQPNPIAKGLQQKQTFSIGVVVPELKNVFFAQVIDGIDSIAYKHKYQLIVAQSYEQYEREIETVNHLANRSIDGLIISLSSQTKETNHLLTLQKNGLPIVLFDRVSNSINTHNVITDNFNTAYKATELLIQNGHKNILHIAHPQNLSISQERVNGYKKALENYNIPFDEKLLYYCNYAHTHIHIIEANLLKYLKQKKKPDAIFSSGDRITSIIYSCLTKLKLKIPNDIAFTGFSNNNIIKLFNPNITVIQQPTFEIGQASAQLLIELIESKKPTKIYEKRVMQPIFFI
jgi:LacI family transcriptional regulator